MNGPAGPGRLVLVDLAAPELALLRDLPDQDVLSSAGMDAGLADAADSVAVVVIGSLAGSAVSVVQRAHRLVPHAGIAVLAADPATTHRQVSFAPGVPLDLLIAAVDDGDLPHRLQELRRAAADRRRHASVLAAVARSATVAAVTGPMGRIAVGALLEHAPIGVLVTRLSGELLGWNRRAEELMGLRLEMTGQSVDAVLPGALAMTAAAVSPVPPGSDPPPALNVRIGTRALEISAVSSETDQGLPVVLLLAVDVTAQHRAEQERDRLLGHVELLGRISESLMHSLDVSLSLARLARALVPRLADWVCIQVLAEREHLHDVVVHHRDPGRSAIAREAEQLMRSAGCLTEPSRRATGGEQVLLPRLASEGLLTEVPDPELRSLVERLGMAGAIAVPIPGRVGVLGSLLLANGPDGGPFVEADLALAVEIGRRAGIALDNGRLYAGQRHVATELQRSLLTAPPVLPFADIAVRYVAAAREAQVGGDWYDAFRQRDGALTVVIGDVVGHDTRAAAAMGQLRSLVRGIAFTTANAPAEVLTAVDEAIDGLQLATIATAVVAQVFPPGDADGLDGARLRWSNAGHPPPVLLDAEGRSHVLGPGTGKADLLLGIDATTRRTTEQIVLPAGSTLLLYTDGLVERRAESLDDGLDKLRSTVERHGGQGLDRLCDAILHNMVPQAGEDDVAIVAVRPRAVAPPAAERDAADGR